MLLARFSAIILLVGIAFTSHSQSLPSCSNRPKQALLPRVTMGFCLELAVHQPQEGEMAFTALAFAPDGTLYASRPLRGQVVAMTDTDGDLLVDSPRVIAEGLNSPNALVWHQDALYIGVEGGVMRWQEGIVSPVIEGLPVGAFMTSALAIYDDRLWVGVGAPCNLCEFDRETFGVVWSYALDGTDGISVAKGLRQPMAFAVLEGALYISDVAPYGTENAFDELNRVENGTDYGFPLCITGDELACAGTQAPTLRFLPQVAPVAFLPYVGQAFPLLEGKMLMAMMGKASASIPIGYELTALDATPPNPEEWQFTPIAPVDNSIVDVVLRVIPSSWGVFYDNPTSEYLSRRGAGFYPHLFYGVAISPEGWIYLASGGGRLYALRNL